MGNVDSRSNFDCGNIMLQTDLPFYQPNDMVTGKVYLRTTKPIDAKFLELEVSGKEKTGWLDHEYKQVRDSGGKVKYERITVKRKDKR